MSATTKHCILCNGELGEIVFSNLIDRLGMLPGTWDFVRCKNCESLVLDPMPSDEELLSAYPAVYSADQAPQTHPLHRWLHQLETKMFYEPMYRASTRQVLQMTGLKSGKMLDVGGGTGKRTVYFKKAGFDAWVLEPEEQPLQIAREMFGLNTICNTLDAAELPKESFDLITFFAVIEHLPNPAATLEITKSLLRPGGWLVLLAPISNSLQRRIFGLRWHEAREAPRHVTLPTSTGMQSLLARNGFNLKASESDIVINRAGVMALSLVYDAKSDIACATTKVSSRVFNRVLGGIAMISCIPLAFVESLLKSPSIGVFAAQKPFHTSA